MRQRPWRHWRLSRAVGIGRIAALTILTLWATALVGSASNVHAAPPAELPHTPDYHSLLVSGTQTLLLGTHDGLYRSIDGGRSWKQAGLENRDAMHLARQGTHVVWAAGHGVLARSRDGGMTWADVRPGGLPGLDVHAFAVDPRDPRRLFAAIAGQGLYRSSDGGSTFVVVSRDIGPGVMALVVLPDGTVVAGDVSRSVVAVSKDGGSTWRGVVRAQVTGLAVDPRTGLRVLASGPGVLLSADGGLTWRQVLRIASGTGPVAWAADDPRIAYAVGLDRSLYRTTDRGATWKRIVRGMA